MALTELSRYVPRLDQRVDLRSDNRSRYLRGGVRLRDGLQAAGSDDAQHGGFPGMELPPGASFDPDPHTNFSPSAVRDEP
jgi:putative (di)nucleoside polyphosphate hydrolase